MLFSTERMILQRSPQGPFLTCSMWSSQVLSKKRPIPLLHHRQSKCYHLKIILDSQNDFSIPIRAVFREPQFTMVRSGSQEAFSVSTYANRPSEQFYGDKLTFNSQIKFVILLVVNRTILMMIVQRSQYWINQLSLNGYFSLFFLYHLSCRYCIAIVRGNSVLVTNIS